MQARRRRGVVVGFVGALALVAAACGGNDSGDGSSATTTAKDAAATTAASGSGAKTDASAPKLAIVYSAEWKDGSWGEAALNGANKLKAEGLVSEVALQENVQPGADGERALRAFAEKGYNPIVAHSFNYGDDVKKVAKDFPKTIFAYAGGFGDITANVADYSQPFYEASYLLGILAAGGVPSGQTAGAAGFDIPVCRAMFNSFTDGAKLIRPDTTGSFVAVGDWYDVQKAKEAALGQADKGATMFIGCGQGPTFGQIEAAAERKSVAMGYVGDMSSRGNSVLASFTWNLDKVFAEMVADVKAGKVNPVRYYEISMKQGSLDIVISPEWKSKISAAAMKEYETKLAAIKAGSFTVPFNAK